MDLGDSRVTGVPEKIYYIPNFIIEDEETMLINQINNSPKPKWTQLAHRRLQNWGGLPHVKGMIAEDLPGWLSAQVDKVSRLGLFETDKRPNHVLINEYLSGQGIMPHTDGPLFYPTVTTITCGSHTVLDFYPRIMDIQDENKSCDRSTPEVSLLLERRSLVVVQAHMYENMLHGIAERTSDVVPPSPGFPNVSADSYKAGQILERGTRLSLTIRHVPKTRKLHGLFKVK